VTRSAHYEHEPFATRTELSLNPPLWVAHGSEEMIAFVQLLPGLRNLPGSDIANNNHLFGTQQGQKQRSRPLADEIARNSLAP
jgi:hypothetical protein